MTYEYQHRFLNEVLGYNRLDDLLSRGIKGTDFRAHFEGTIIGTFRTQGGALTNLPRIPMIYGIAEQETQTTEGGGVRFAMRGDRARNVVLSRGEAGLGLPYVIDNAMMFGNHTPSDIAGIVHEYSALFPGADYFRETKYPERPGRRKTAVGFKVGFKAESFYFLVEGGTTRDKKRFMKILFDADPDIVRAINEKVSEYYKRVHGVEASAKGEKP